jgi:unsaturated rhamnogalacturonyl hydrolase
MKYVRLTTCAVALASLLSCAKQQPVQEETPRKLSIQMAHSEMKRVPNTVNLDFRTSPKWNYSAGLELYSFLQVAQRYNDKALFAYVYSYVDTMIHNDGTIYKYDPQEYNIDHVNAGKLLFGMYDITHEQRFKKASELLRSQMLTHPRTTEGGWWHKNVYAHQMWLDGLYMGAPFIAEYGKRNDEDVAEDVVKQFLIVGKHTYDASTRLYRHAWDESLKQFWADPVTGCSRHAWGRANGWFMMAMVDVLALVPEQTAGRDSLLSMFRTLSETLLEYRDDASGMWYQVLDSPKREGNYVESSCSAMFTYAFLKGSRLGLLDEKFKSIGRECFNKFVTRFVKENEDGTISVTDCCAVAGLGGKNMRDGSFDYYINEPIRDNDPKTIGPFVLSCLELNR